jgi:hypothetical protein
VELRSALNETFTRREVLSIVAAVGLSDDEWENWQRDPRGFLLKWERTGDARPQRPVGKGVRREYSILDALYLAILKILAPTLPNMVSASDVAQAITLDTINGVLISGPARLPIFAIHELKPDPALGGFIGPDDQWTRTLVHGKSLGDILALNPRCFGRVVLLDTSYVFTLISDRMRDVLEERQP